LSFDTELLDLLLIANEDKIERYIEDIYSKVEKQERFSMNLIN
jgi:hypothetical protein